MMIKTVAERGKYFYEFSEHLSTLLLKYLCCCLVSRKPWFIRRIKREKRHAEARKRLAKEIDIVEMLYSHRISQLLARVVLKKHQRALVSSFMKYQVDDLGRSSKANTLDDSVSLDSSLLLQPSIQDMGEASTELDPSIAKVL